MSLHRAESGWMGCFELALLVHTCLLPLIGLVVLTAWGAILLVTAHSVHPIHTTGVIADIVDVFDGNTYEATEVKLLSDGTDYRVYRPGLGPAILEDRPQVGERITLWFDPDADWGNLSETRILALSLAGEGTDPPAHRLDDFDNPDAAAMRQRLVGAGVLGLIALIVGLGALWERFFDRHRPDDPFPMGIP